MAMKPLCHILFLTTHALTITHSYDSGSAAFTESASEANCILIQDYEEINLVIAFEGPNLTPAHHAKELENCLHGGLNYANLIKNFRLKFASLLANSGIATKTLPVVTTSTTTPAVTQATQNRSGRYIDEYYVNSYEEMTAYFQTTLKISESKTLPKLVTDKHTSTTPSTTVTTTTPISTPSTSTTIRLTNTTPTITTPRTTSTATTSSRSTSTILTKTTTSVTSTSKTRLPTAHATNTKSTTTTTTITKSTITTLNDSDQRVYTATKGSITRKISTTTDTQKFTDTATNEQIWISKWNPHLETTSPTFGDLFTSSLRGSKICGLGPMTTKFFKDDTNLLLQPTLNGCTINETTHIKKEIYKFKLDKQMSSLLDSNDRIKLVIDLNKINKFDSMHGRLFFKLGILKTQEFMNTYENLNFRASTDLYLQSDTLTNKANEKAQLIFSLTNITSVQDQLKTADLVITIIIKGNTSYFSKSNLKLVLPLSELPNLFKAHLNLAYIKYQLHDTSKRIKRFIETAAGVALGVLGDQFIRKIGNYFSDEQADQTSSKIITLSKHLEKFETLSLETNKNIEREFIKIHSQDLKNNKNINALICQSALEAEKISEQYLELTIAESLNEIDTLSNEINSNSISINHPFTKNLIAICSKRNLKAITAEKLCAEIIRDRNLSQLSKITYDEENNEFLLYLKSQIPLFKALTNTNVTNYTFLKNLNRSPGNDAPKITRIKSDKFSSIQSPELPHDLFYKNIKYDKLTQTFIIRADMNSDYFDASIIDCLDRVTTNVCPYESYRSSTDCVIEKFTTVCDYKFIHFSASEPIVVSAINTEYHGVLFKEKFHSDKLSKIFPRYNKNPLQVRCGSSTLNLGLDPKAADVTIHLKSLTSEIDTYDELERLDLKQTQQNNELKMNIDNLTEALNALDTDTTLSLGNKNIIDTKSIKFIVVGLTLFVVVVVMIYIFKKCKSCITNFWRQRYRPRPVPAPRYQSIRLSNRNIRAVSTNT